MGNNTVTGNIELHTQTSDWQTHGHHLDTHYNRVVLHVVYRNNRRLFTTRQDGVQIPVLSLYKVGFPSEDISVSKQITTRPCHTAISSTQEQVITNFLETAGDDRFTLKSDRFAAQLSCTDARQVLYQGIMEGLGYSKNQAAFRDLAGTLPLAVLQPDAASAITDSEYFLRTYCRLLKAAGIRSINLEPESREQEREAGSPIPHSFDWQSFRIRPGNSPEVRLVAMACLLVRYRNYGLLETLLHIVRDSPEGEGNHTLENFLIVSAKEQLVALILPNTSGPLGKNRAVEIIVNILLPFTHAFGRLYKDFDLSSKIISLYHRQEKTSGNSLERHMIKQLGLSGKMISRACYQQGLLHIYREFCIRGRCGNCRLSKLEIRNHIQA